MEGEVVIPIDLDTKRFDRQIDKVEDELFQIDEKLKHAKELKLSEKDVVKLQEQAEKLNNKLVSLNQQKEKWNKQDLKSIDLSGIGNATENIIRKVLKWGLALFSIRSIYNFIRGSVSLLAQDNEQLGADIEYIRWALASTLQPIIEGIIQLAFTLLTYINYIANAWFGVNLFAKASAENFKKTKDGVKGVNNEAKKLQKTLAGFDEMNILQENGSTSVGGGGGGIALPSTDLSMLKDVEIPGWVDWIANNKDTIVNAIIDIAKTFALFKILEWLVPALGMFGDGISKLGLVLRSVGIVLIVVGLWNAMSDLLELITNPSWDTFYKLIGDLSLALAGLGLVLVTINASNPFGWITMAIGGIGLLVGAIGGLVSSEEEEKNAYLSSEDAAKRLYDARENLTNTTSKYTKAVKRAEQTSQDLKKAEDEMGLSGEKLFRQVQYGILDYSKLNEQQRKVYDAYLEHKDAQEQLTKATDELRGAKTWERQEILETTIALSREGKAYGEEFKTIVEGVQDGTYRMSDFRRDIVYIFSALDDKGRETFIKNLPDDVMQTLLSFKDFSRTMYLTDNETLMHFSDIVANAKKSFEKDIPNSIEKTNKAAGTLKSAFQGISNIISKFAGVNIKFSTGGVGYAKGGIVTRLATGGIVNRPGRGVPIASASMGEAGREGILPLTDSQAMETLGQAIGRYISINATVPVYVGNRQVAREIRKIEANDDFAYNGG